MKILLDTCTFLWIIVGSDKLSETAIKLFQDPSNEVFLSSASSWEISVKCNIGKLTLPKTPQEFIPTRRATYGIQTLPIDEESTLQLNKLPNIHNDPFDRILISQALNHSLTILTPDKEISQYPVKMAW